jgi:hypothetical protein
MDASGQVNQYRWPIYAVVSPDAHGEGVPLAYMITSSEASEPVTKFLEVLHAANPHTFNPSVIMIDASLVEVKAIRDYSLSQPMQLEIRICFFHLMQAWERWLKRSENKVAKVHQEGILRIIRVMKQARDAATYQHHLDVLKKYTDCYSLQHVMKYFTDTWGECKWAGRGAQGKELDKGGSGRGGQECPHKCPCTNTVHTPACGHVQRACESTGAQG